MARGIGLGNTRGMEVSPEVINRSNDAAENYVANDGAPPVNGAGNDFAIDEAPNASDAENDIAIDGAPSVNFAKKDITIDGAPSVSFAEDDISISGAPSDNDVENFVTSGGTPSVNDAENDVIAEPSLVNDAENDIAIDGTPSVNDAGNNVIVGAPVGDAEKDFVSKKPVNAAENDVAIAVKTPPGNEESSVVSGSTEGLLVHNSETSMGKEQSTHHHQFHEASGQSNDMNKEPMNGHYSVNTPSATSLLEACSSDQTGAPEVIQLNNPLEHTLSTETTNGGGNQHQQLEQRENQSDRNTQGGPDVVDSRIAVILDVHSDESMNVDENQEIFNEFHGPDVVDSRIAVILDVNSDESMNVDENQEIFNEFEVSWIQRAVSTEFVQQSHPDVEFVDFDDDHEFVRVSESGSMNFNDFDDDQEFISVFESNRPTVYM